MRIPPVSRCQCCRAKRPDALVDVASKTIVVARGSLTISVRHCADRAACRWIAPRIVEKRAREFAKSKDTGDHRDG